MSTTYRVSVKRGDDATVTTIARGVDLAAASSLAAQHPDADRFVIEEATDTVTFHFRPRGLDDVERLRSAYRRSTREETQR